jgi:hypothetical protein
LELNGGTVWDVAVLHQQVFCDRFSKALQTDFYH